MHDGLCWLLRGDDAQRGTARVQRSQRVSSRLAAAQFERVRPVVSGRAVFADERDRLVEIERNDCPRGACIAHTRVDRCQRRFRCEHARTRADAGKFVNKFP